MLSEHRVDKTDSVRFMIMVTVTLVALHLIYFPRVTVLNNCTLKTLVTCSVLHQKVKLYGERSLESR